jgi:hypothetical protein
VHFSALPAVNTPTSSGEPKSMLVSLGAGNERLARVATDSGTVTRWLQTNGSQMLMTFGADSSVAYQPTPDGCGSTWTAINTATGASRAAFEKLGRPAEIAVASDNTRIAYVDVGPQERVPDGRGGTMPAGCPTAPHALVISDPASGATATYPIANYDLSLYPAFDSTGTRLAFVWHRQVRILDLNHDTALNDATPLSTGPSRGCTQTKPVWKPGTNTVLVAELCGQIPAIAGYDAGSGKQTYRHPVAGPALIGSFAVDSSGEHLVYSSSRLDGPGSSIFAVEPAGDRHIIDDGYQADW